MSYQALPAGAGADDVAAPVDVAAAVARVGAVAVAVDSKDNVWVVQRAPVGVDSISKFDANGKRLLTLGDSVVGHLNKAHGMNVDAQDNAYFADPSGAVIIKVSPDGKVLGEIGTRGKRGDWDETKGQRLLWEPVSIAFDPRNGDMYIGEGHGAESPNDRQSGEVHNTSGAARVIRLDKNGKFISQIYGNMMGAGHFWMAHDVAIDPTDRLWLIEANTYPGTSLHELDRAAHTIGYARHVAG